VCALFADMRRRGHAGERVGGGVVEAGFKPAPSRPRNGHAFVVEALHATPLPIGRTRRFAPTTKPAPHYGQTAKRKTVFHHSPFPILLSPPPLEEVFRTECTT
jgi:hypothetical protein